MLQMPARSGRLEKRIRVAVPVELATPQDPTATERTSTEDVCPIGARVLTQRPRERNERVIIRSVSGNLRAQARVVYCQRISEGRFAVGLQFMGTRVKEW